MCSCEFKRQRRKQQAEANCLSEVYLMDCENCYYWDIVNKKCVNQIKICYKLLTYKVTSNE